MGLNALPEHKRKHSSALITASQRQRTIMQPHDLTRKAQSDAGAFLLGREERNEYLVLALTADRKTVIGDVDDCLLGWNELGSDGYISKARKGLPSLEKESWQRLHS